MAKKKKEKKKKEEKKDLENDGLEIIKNRKYAALFKDSGKLYISVSIPRQENQLSMLSGEIFNKLHKKIKNSGLPLKIYSVAFPGNRDSTKVLYLLLDEKANANAEEVFEKVYELFNESILESSFSDPMRFMTVQEASMSFSIRTAQMMKELKSLQGKACKREGDVKS